MIHTPEINQRVHHATDEEKLASTGIMTLTADSQEDPECTKAPGKKQPTSGTSDMEGVFGSSEMSLKSLDKRIYSCTMHTVQL